MKIFSTFSQILLNHETFLPLNFVVYGMCICCLQTWRKGWVVISTKGLVNCTLEYYKDEDQWLTPSKSTKKITICELLKDVKSIKCTSSSYKCHIMSIVYDNYSILIGFKSRTIMQSWITNLDDMRGAYIHT